MNVATLIASLIWGSVGTAMFIFGKKQQSAGALFGGLGLMGAAYFVESAVYMSVVGVGVICGVIWWGRRG